MKTQFSSVSRITSLIAGIIAAVIAIAGPCSYFLVSRYYLLANLKTDNELTASAITKIIATNPKTWRFEEIRISEILHRRDQKDVFECRRVLDGKGMEVAKSIEEMPWPTISSTLDIYDAGMVVAWIEHTRSIRPMVIRTALVAALSIVLGGLVFVVLRLIPMRAVATAYGKLSQNEIRYRSLYNSIREGLGLFSPINGTDNTLEDLELIDANPALERILEKPSQELIGMRGASVLGGVLLNYRLEIAQVMADNSTFRFETRDAGREHYYDVNVFAPTPSTFAVLVEDVTERKRAEEQIHRLAYYDHLTQLPNRFLLLERMEQHLARAAREGTSIALLFLDLDRFKHINDTLGHAYGDQLLIEVGKRLSDGRRKCDTIARLGGDEFVLLVFCDDGDAMGITLLAQKLIDRLASPFLIADRQVFSGTSIGIATFPTDGTDCETLLKNADLAMYAAKEAGRNSYCYFTPEMNSRAYARMEMDAKIRHALAHDEFYLVFQPVMDIGTNRVSSAECLIRWRDGSGTLIMPGVFIPVAEESGLILSIGDWVIKEACRKLKVWAEAGLPPVKISVNVSARQFGQRSFLDFLLNTIDSAGIDARFLELELTESSLMEDPQEVAGALNRIKERGLSIAIDDFGTGYSSLSYLTRLPIDRLKVDRSFVREMTSNANDRAIVEAIFAMAGKLGIRVVVEGVEEKEQVAFLATLGCQYVQGYYFHRPLEEENFLKLLTA